MNDIPFISLLIPIRNEEVYIRQSLEAVLHQDYPQDQMEVLIADGRSTDLTRQIVQVYQQKYPNLKLIDNPGKIVPTGINAALRQAKGNVMVRVDGHTLIAPDYASSCVGAFANIRRG